MKTISKLTCVALVLITQPLCADFFQNLDFEDAVIEFDDQGVIIQSSALPFWDTNADFFLYNNFCLGSVCTGIHDGGKPFGATPLEGSYTVHLDPGSEEGDSCYISQTGTIPTGATSLTLLIDSTAPDEFQVYFDGTELTLLSDFPTGITRIVYDISDFAGDSGQLKISQTAPEDFAGAFVDDIRFVPEPSSFSGVAVVLMLLGFRRRRRK